MGRKQRRRHPADAKLAAIVIVLRWDSWWPCPSRSATSSAPGLRLLSLDRFVFGAEEGMLRAACDCSLGRRAGGMQARATHDIMCGKSFSHVAGVYGTRAGVQAARGLSHSSARPRRCSRQSPSLSASSYCARKLPRQACYFPTPATVALAAKIADQPFEAKLS